MSRAGLALASAGAGLIGWQCLRELPWQAGVLLGIALVVAGGLLVVAEPRRPRRTRSRRARPGYLSLGPGGDRRS